MSTDTIALPLAQELLADLTVALAENANVPALICLRYGEDVIGDVVQNGDECCSGSAWVRWDPVYPSGDGFPDADSAALSGCGIMAWAVVLEMGVFRCSPIGDGVNLITCVQHTATAVQLATDQAAMREAVCALLEDKDGGSVVVGPQQQVGPDGGCLGTVQKVTVQVI